MYLSLTLDAEINYPTDPVSIDTSVGPRVSTSIFIPIARVSAWVHHRFILPSTQNMFNSVLYDMAGQFLPLGTNGPRWALQAFGIYYYKIWWYFLTILQNKYWETSHYLVCITWYTLGIFVMITAGLVCYQNWFYCLKCYLLDPKIPLH